MAALILVALTGYSWVVTLVPQGTGDSPTVAAWNASHPALGVVTSALSLHRAYSSPAFVIGMLLLTLSTAACAWDRTRAAAAAWRGRGVVTPATAERLKRSPTFIVEAPGASDRAVALEAAADALRGMGMRVKAGPALVEGSSGAVGLIGSPLFHWCLVGLFAFAGIGQLIRYEGYTNVLVGGSAEDSPGVYAQALDVGRLAGGSFTGLTMTVEDLEVAYVADGVDRGPTPRVSLARGGTVIREQWVYSNNPLRHGALFIHNAKTGPAFVGTVRVASSARPEQVVLHHELEATSTARFGLPDPTREGILTVEVTPSQGKRVAVVVVRGGARAETQTIGVGQAATIYEGATLTADDLTAYVQLHVVNDPSVPWIYASFALGCAAAFIMVFVQPRTVRVMAVDRDAAASPEGQQDGVWLHVVIVRRGSDPAFPRRVERALFSAVADGSAEARDEETAE